MPYTRPVPPRRKIDRASAAGWQGTLTGLPQHQKASSPSPNLQKEELPSILGLAHINGRSPDLQDSRSPLYVMMYGVLDDYTVHTTNGPGYDCYK